MCNTKIKLYQRTKRPLKKLKNCFFWKEKVFKVKKYKIPLMKLPSLIFFQLSSLNFFSSSVVICKKVGQASVTRPSDNSFDLHPLGSFTLTPIPAIIQPHPSLHFWGSNWFLPEGWFYFFRFSVWDGIVFGAEGVPMITVCVCYASSLFFCGLCVFLLMFCFYEGQFV